jgi:hypothetical protein
MRRLCITLAFAATAVTGVLVAHHGPARQSASTICIGSIEIGRGDHPIIKTPIICIPAP